jgi:hypothetical protein
MVEEHVPAQVHARASVVGEVGQNCDVGFRRFASAWYDEVERALAIEVGRDARAGKE